MNCTSNVAKTKALISFAVTAKADLRLCLRICKIRFSHDAAQVVLTWGVSANFNETIMRKF